jgi:hypothetical protein
MTAPRAKHAFTAVLGSGSCIGAGERSDWSRMATEEPNSIDAAEPPARASDQVSPPDTARELNVFLHDGHALPVKRAQVGILKEMDHIRFSSFLKCENSSTLPSQGVSGIDEFRVTDVSNEACKWELSDQQVCRPLVMPNFL